MNKALLGTLGAVLAVIISCLTVYTFVEGRAKARAQVEEYIRDNQSEAVRIEDKLGSDVEKLEQRLKDWKVEVTKDIWVLEGQVSQLKEKNTALQIQIAEMKAKMSN